MADEVLDVAIVGAGVSGVYSAWRLKQADPARTIVVFEAADHVGGRLLSVRPPDIPHMVAELGGMRILPAVQPRITKLIDVLNKAVPRADRIETYDFPVDEPQNIAYLRGVHLRLSDFTARPDKVPYHLAFLECGDTAGRILVNAIERIVPGIADPSLDEAERREIVKTATFAGEPLHKQGFWNVLMRVISGEAYELGVDAGGYNSPLSNWNAADAIPWFLSDFGVAPDYKGFRQGFQQVPRTLARLFTDAGGEIRLNTVVDGIDADGDGCAIVIDEQTIRARTLILAMPRRALDLLAPASPPLREISDLLACVTPRPLFKLFTTYSNPWWRSAGYTADGRFIPVESGRTLTDLPVRQTYYWPNDDGTPARSGPAMLMASYDDGANIGFWDGLRPRRHLAWHVKSEIAALPDAFEGDDCSRHPELEWCRYKAPRRMVEEVARQLAIIHGLSYCPDVRNAAFRDWGDDPFGGGWNSWNIGVKSWEAKERIVQPFADRQLFICGEAYSDAQGWVEGALQTADMMLSRLGHDSL